MMKDLGLELYKISFELELLEAELEKSKAAFRWLVENGNSNGDYLDCPYHRFSIRIKDALSGLQESIPYLMTLHWMNGKKLFLKMVTAR